MWLLALLWLGLVLKLVSPPIERPLATLNVSDVAVALMLVGNISLDHTLYGGWDPNPMTMMNLDATDSILSCRMRVEYPNMARPRRPIEAEAMKALLLLM